MTRELPKWTMRDGRTIKISEMDDNHLKNSYAMLNRNGFVSERDVILFLVGTGPSGDGARCAWEQERDFVLGAPVCTVMDDIREELKSRGYGEFADICESGFVPRPHDWRDVAWAWAKVQEEVRNGQ